ncbi:biotin--[acetyl-CoA-carboxylase] ligase [Suttonella ornithocola]|uniref:Bifunctional protein BirA n=1 Tax=Suttonella ornithocola TaxID=279832 RepID=A0A380MRQ6_9GAMM|nr:biotin--[acetyl-CoA-carboxylase] ligase [Suttonella ornithocola]SUO94992.1 Bifunctional protein BirA [Suttonella ornithocola]
MPQQAHHYHFATLDSTQRFLIDHSITERPIFCRANQQTAGIGQRGAHWQSPIGGLYFSLRYQLDMPPAAQGGLAQYIALTLAQTIDPNAKILRLKWPNDLYIEKKKLGGILIDTLPHQEQTIAIIGIGINLYSSPETDSNLAYYSDYFAQTETLYESLCEQLLPALEYWNTHPYLPTDHRWDDYDRFHGQMLSLETHHEPVENIGIDQKGRLIIRDQQSKIAFLDNTRIKN